MAAIRYRFPSSIALMSKEEQEKEFENIIKQLEDEVVETITLVGDVGVGKTWMARKINNLIINSENRFYGNLWISINRKYESMFLYDVLAHQLSVQASTDDYPESNVRKESEELESEITNKLEEMENEKLREMAEKEKPGGSDTPFLLVILDGIHSDNTTVNAYEEGTRAELKRLLPKESKTMLKFLVTRRKDKVSNGEVIIDIEPFPVKRSGVSNVEVIIEIEPLPEKESGALFMKLLKTSIPGRENFEASIAEIAKKSNGLPIAVVKLVAEALNLSGANDLELSKSKNTLKEVANYEEVDKCTSFLLHFAIRMLHGSHHGSWSTPGNDTLVNCYWHSWEFISKHGAIDYNVLIFSWILEGYFGSVDHIKQKYEEGHRVLMKLMGCGLLKMLEDNLVIMEELVLPILDCRRVGYEQRSVLGLARVWKGFGTLAPSDYMIRTPTKEDKYISTLLIHGSRLSRAEPETFFKPMLGLQNLAIIDPSFKSLPPSLSEMEKLQMLVLRGCDQLQNIDDIQQLKSLIVLEISDACFLENIKDDLFEQMTNLRSLNFCGVPIKTLPSSLCKLSQLHWLILRRCSSLESLPSLKAHTNLEVLDLSGSTSLLKIRDKTFSHLKKIQFLDFSHTSIKRLPFLCNLGNLENLTRLLLHDCKLTTLTSFTSDKLKILDLSKTEIKSLPSDFGNFPNLELLDLSYTSKLVKIPENAFENMVCLYHLNLSNTKLESLPKISNLVNLRHLDFSHTKIKILPSLAKLNNLHALNPSGIGLTLPYISNLTNLTQLSLRGCLVPDQSEPNFGEHKKLEVLDLSETLITSLPSLENLTSLRELKLRGCSKLEQLQHLESLAHLEVLDLWETGIKKFQNEIYELTHLKQLDLPKGIQEFDLQKMKRLPEELNWNECCILEHWQKMPCISVNGTKSFQDLVKENPEFHFSVCPEQGRAGEIHWHKVDPIFRRIYFKTPEKCCQYLEIVEFISFPLGVKDALKKAAYVSLIGNNIITRLSDLGVGNVDAMKGCWLQRCSKMEILGEETEAEMVGNLEILWASNIPKLKHVYSGIEPGGGFKNLTEMYLDCCPLLKFVFLSSQFPEKLKILQIKFCDDLERLFEPNVLDADKKWSLQKLHLVELPKLTGMGVPKSKKIRDVFPSLEAIKVKECPMLEIVLEQIEEAGGCVENSNNVEEHWYEKTPTRSVYGQC